MSHTRVVTVTNKLTPQFPWSQESHGYDRGNHGDGRALFVSDITLSYHGYASQKQSKSEWPMSDGTSLV
jgi:hypothetical protein